MRPNKWADLEVLTCPEAQYFPKQADPSLAQKGRERCVERPSVMRLRECQAESKLSLTMTWMGLV